MDKKEITDLKNAVLKEHKENRQNALKSAERLYSELNSSELLVATGAFVLLLNFLIGNKNLKHIEILHIGIASLVFMIIIKSLSYRRAAELREREVDISDARSDLDSKAINKMLKIVSGEALPDDSYSELILYKEKSKKMDAEFEQIKNSKVTGKVLNEIEYYLYLMGIIIVLGFFMLNAVIK